MHPAKRIVIYTGRILGSMGLLIASMYVWKLYLEEPTLAISSHLIHGNIVVFQGRTMRLPLWWRAQQPNAKTLTLRRTMFRPSLSGWGNMGISAILEIGSLDPARTGDLDNKSASLWQAQQIASLQIRQPGIRVEARNIRSKSLTFYCFEVAKSDILGCKPAGIDWLILFAGVATEGAPKQLEEAAAILESVQ